MDAERRRLRLLLIYAAMALPAIAWGAQQALRANHNSPLDWVPPTFAPRAEYDAFCNRFGPGDTVVISWPGCSLAEERLDRFAEILRTARVFHDDDGQWLFHDVITGREAVAGLAGSGAETVGSAGMSPAEAAARLSGSLVGPDQATTAVVITFTAAGLQERGRLVAKIRRAATVFCGVAANDQRLAGPVIDGLSVDTASQETLSKFAAPSAIVVFLLCWGSLRSLKAAGVVFGLAAFCQGATLALVHYAGDSMTALLIVLPPLVQVLAVAGGIHLANYFFDGQDAAVEQPARRALQIGWLPCVLSGGTTAIGMASLASSELSPIRSFGVYSAVGVLITTAALLSLLPAMFLFWPPQRATPTRVERQTNVARRSDSRWFWLASCLGTHHAVLSLAGVAVIAAGGWFASRLSTSVRIDTLFATNSRILEDYRWLEEHVAPLVPLEVVLTCDRTCPLSPIQRLEVLWHLGRRLNERPEIQGVFSAADCVPAVPQLEELSPEQRATVLNEALLEFAPRFEQINLLRRDGSSETWRLTLRTSALGTADYAAMLAAIRGRWRTRSLHPWEPRSPASPPR